MILCPLVTVCTSTQFYNYYVLLPVIKKVDHLCLQWFIRRKRGEWQASIVRDGGGGPRKNIFFRAVILAPYSPFALTSILPLFAYNTQQITPILQATWYLAHIT